MPDFALCGMTKVFVFSGGPVAVQAARPSLAVLQFLNLPFKVHSPFKSLGTSIPGYVCLVANPLPVRAFFQLVTFGLKR